MTTARACTATSRSGRTASRCSTTRLGYAGLSDIARWYIGGLLKHAPSAARLHQPDGELATTAWSRASRRRSTWSTRPATARPASASRSRAPTRRPSASSSACRTRRPTRTSRSRRMLMAGLDGIKNKIEPPEPIDKDLYELPPDEAADIPQVPGSLGEVLDALEADHDFLHRGRRLHRGPDRAPGSTTSATNEIDPVRAAPAPVRVRALLRHLSRRHLIR